MPTTIEGLSDSEAEQDEDGIDLVGNEEQEDDDVAGYTVENSFLEEKEDTCVALRELSLHCGYVIVAAWLILLQINFKGEFFHYLKGVITLFG